MEPNREELLALLPDIAAQLRNSLSTLRLAADRLAGPEAREQDPELDRQAAYLDQNYYRMLRLVVSLSTVARLTKEEPLHRQDRDIVALVSDACESCSSLAESLGLELKFLCARDRRVIAMDPDLIEQLLYHLLSNAFKYTPRGGAVTVELKFKNRQVYLTVSDTGQGMTPEQRDAVMGAALRPETVEPSPRGIGLGIPLCRRIAALHGGALVASSGPDGGACFTMSLPDQALGTTLSDLPARYDFAGGFNRTLLGLADALPWQAFLLRSQK